jgi:fluoride exporter
LLIGVGAFVGANVRYLITIWSVRHYGTAFPYGTVLANLAGCVVIGLFLGILTARFGNDIEARLLVATGFLGAETTFSAFAYESVSLLRNHQYRPAIWNILISTGVGLVGTALGLAFADIVTGGAW